MARVSKVQILIALVTQMGLSYSRLQTQNILNKMNDSKTHQVVFI